jgi:hypothetical protein
MDPTLERDELSPLVEQWQSARQLESNNERETGAIADIIDTELERRWDLTERAYALMTDNDRPINAGVSDMVVQAHAEFWYQHQRIELRLADPSQGPAFIAHPETDFHGSAAASRYLAHAAADEAYIGYLVHGDQALFEEACADGRAFTARVLEVSDVGTGKSTVPRWLLMLDPSRPNRLRLSRRECGLL